nr:hypothetical protein [Tanacetum cinerariifolium]
MQIMWNYFGKSSCTSLKTESSRSKKRCTTESGYNQSFGDNTYPHDLPGVTPLIDHHCCYKCGDSLDSFFCHQCTCEFCGNGAHDSYNCPSQCRPMNYFESNPCYDSNYSGFDQIKPSQNSINPPLNIQNELDNQELFINEIIQQKLQNENAQPFSAIAITLELPTVEPKDSLKIGDEHLDTILETESDEFIKTSIENLVPNLSESEDDSECDVSVFDDFTTFSNLLFDIDSLLDEFAGELILLKSIPSGIDKTDCDPKEEIRLIEKLLYDNASPRPPEEFISENSDATIESFFPSPIPVEDSDPFTKEIDLFLASDESIPPCIDSDYSDSKGDNIVLERLLHDDPIPLLENESFHFDIPSSPPPPAKPSNDEIKLNSRILTVKVVTDIKENDKIEAKAGQNQARNGKRGKVYQVKVKVKVKPIKIGYGFGKSTKNQSRRRKYLIGPTRAVPAKIARKFKKTSPSKKDNVTRGKGIELLSGVALTEKSSDERSNDDENKSDDDKTPSDSEKDPDFEQDSGGSESDSESDQQEYEEEVKDNDDEDDDDDDDKSKGDEDRGMDAQQFNNDIQDKKADVEMTNVEDAYVTITTVAKEFEVPDASVSQSSDLASKFLKFLDIHPNDVENVSPLDVHVHHERRRQDKDKDECPSIGSNRGLKKRKTSKDAEPTTSPKTKDSPSKSSKGTKSQPKSSGKTVHSKEPEFKVGDTDTPQGQEGNMGNDDVEPRKESASRHDWFTKTSRPQEPTDADWNEDNTPQKGPTQNWLMTLAASTSIDKSLKDFDELISTLIDFSSYILNGMKIKNLT